MKNKILKIILVIIVITNTSCKSELNEKTILLNELFTNKIQNIEIIENDSVKLDGFGIPLISENTLYFPSTTYNNIYKITNEKTNIINKDNNKLMLKFPYQIIKKNSFYIVNDRGNQKIKILDSNFMITKEIRINGQIDKIIPINNKNCIDCVIIHGVLKDKNDSRPYLYAILDNNFNIIKYFGRPNKNLLYYSWRSAIDINSNLYSINVNSNELIIYDSNGNEINSLKIETKNSEQILKYNDFKNLHPNQIIQQTKNIDHKLISNIFITDKNILIQYVDKNSNRKSNLYCLDVFNLNGNYMFSTILNNKQIIAVDNKFLWTKISQDDEYSKHIYSKFIINENIL